MSIPATNPKIVIGPDAMGTVTAAAGAVTLGSELVTNGAFTGAATGWTLGAGWAYETNDVRHTAGNTATMYPTTALTVVAGYRYECTVTLAGRTAGSITLTLGGATSAAQDSDGAKTIRLQAVDTTNLIITPTTDFDGDIDTVSVKRCGLDDGDYYFVVAPFVNVGGTYRMSTYDEAHATTSAGAGLGKVDLSWSAVEYADGYRVYQVDAASPTVADLIATYEDGAWSVGTGTATTYTVQASVTPAGAVPAATSPVTLWLPRGFSKWDRNKVDGSTVKAGLTYTARSTFPVLYEITCDTPSFLNSTESWDGISSTTFSAAWDTYWPNVIAKGRPVRVYKKADDSTAGLSYFARSVYTSKDDGLNLQIGREAYKLALAWRTEGAAR